MYFGVKTVPYLDEYKIRILVWILRVEILDMFLNYITPVKQKMLSREYVVRSFIRRIDKIVVVMD